MYMGGLPFSEEAGGGVDWGIAEREWKERREEIETVIRLGKKLTN